MVLISGSSGGIGLATVDRFLAAGFEVLGVDLVDPPSARRGLRTVRADVRDPSAIEAALRELPAGAEIRHVVGLAGRPTKEEEEIMTQPPAIAGANFHDSVQLNLTGQFNLVRCAFDRLMAAPGDRSITFCSSVNALGAIGAPAYSAAKAGLSGMMNSLLPTLSPAGIRINTVAPGTIRTPLTEAESGGWRGRRRRFKRAAEQIPLGRVGMPEDVAATIEALALRMTHVTGELIRVDGGQLLPKVH